MGQLHVSNQRRHTVLLGGLGGDSHSVGLTILRQGLSAHCYQVQYLGTQNTLADFFQMASLTNLVMISSMDGHARYYLREFSALKRQFNTNGIELIQRGLAAASDCAVDETRVAEECAVIRREVEAIFESIVFCGNGDIAQGVVTGFEKGLIDIPFSPSVHNRGEVMTTRDVEGAVRFLATGNLSLDRESREFHQDKVSDRRKAEGISSPSEDHLLVERDVMQVACCRYEQWPLGQ